MIIKAQVLVQGSLWPAIPPKALCFFDFFCMTGCGVPLAFPLPRWDPGVGPRNEVGLSNWEDR